MASLYGGVSDGYAKRTTVVVNQDGTIAHTDTGMAALIPDPAIDACPRSGKATTL